MIERFSDNEIRNCCRSRIEILEFWLRRLIDDALSRKYGDYFNCQDDLRGRVIKRAIIDKVDERLRREPNRYSRRIDAILLDDAVSIICNLHLYKNHFELALKRAFPNGHVEAKTFMDRLLEVRNRLSHANPISVHHAEQVVCYTSDIIASIKQYYIEQGMNEQYNVPTIIKVIVSFGNMFHRGQMFTVHDGDIMMNLSEDARFALRPGDSLSLEIEVDPSFESSSYTISWRSVKPLLGLDVNSPCIVIPINN